MKHDIFTRFAATTGWLAGAIFLIPASAAGIEQAFGLCLPLAYAGAIAVTLAASAGLAAGGFRGIALAAVGLSMAIASDGVSLWAALERANPIEAARTASEGAAALVVNAEANAESARLRVEAHRADMASEESAGGRGPNWRNLSANLAPLVAAHDAATVAASEARKQAADAASDYASAKEGQHPLSRQEWKPAAVLGFTALFEIALCLLASLATAGSRGKERQAVSLEAPDAETATFPAADRKPAGLLGDRSKPEKGRLILVQNTSKPKKGKRNSLGRRLALTA